MGLWGGVGCGVVIGCVGWVDTTPSGKNHEAAFAYERARSGPEITHPQTVKPSAIRKTDGDRQTRHERQDPPPRLVEADELEEALGRDVVVPPLPLQVRLLLGWVGGLF